MAALPVRRRGRNTSTMVVNPSREFEDIYDRMGQLMNFAFGLTPAALADVPWVPLADLSETDDAYVVKAELPGVNKDQVNIQLQDREIVISGEIPEPEMTLLVARSHGRAAAGDGVPAAIVLRGSVPARAGRRPAV